MYWLDKISPQINRIWHGPWPAGFVESARRLYDHELVLFTEGACSVEMDGNSVSCPAGTWIIVPPDRLHVTRAGDQPVYRYCIHFDWDYQGSSAKLPVCAYAPAKPSAGKIHRAPAYVPRGAMRGTFQPGTVGLIETLVFRWQSDDARRRAARATLLEILVELLVPPAGRDQHGDRDASLAFKIKSLLDREPPMDQSLREHLETLGYSYEHLGRLFRRKFGLTPVNYLTALRLERAKRLLRSGLPVKQAAREAGFNDPAYFARVFRKHTGLTPRELQ